MSGETIGIYQYAAWGQATRAEGPKLLCIGWSVEYPVGCSYRTREAAEAAARKFGFEPVARQGHRCGDYFTGIALDFLTGGLSR